MTDSEFGGEPRVAGILMTEEAVYGLILVSGMIVVSGSATGTSAHALVTVVLTVIVFYAAHVYAGALARLTASPRRWRLATSLRAAARRSSGMLFASVPALLILLLGATRIMEDDSAIWTALVVNTGILGILGWVAIGRWNPRWYARAAGAVTTAAFGGALIVVKAVVTH
ncbi:hypothetical protein [Microbacterium invictum]|uniref:Uncharacterized protein n=1 Tax=Microbacterium invictum TaxID=515415 RepID=A0AA40SLU5_9MICO|nr:hypothetical protein [Microbacterium invictum]MBB4138593.1 hypothetical protein [Microbacterium invictum]